MDCLSKSSEEISRTLLVSDFRFFAGSITADSPLLFPERSRWPGSVKPERFVRTVLANQFDFAQCDLILMNGVGNVWPWIRAHSLLNNLQQVTGDIPLLLFYSGAYDGQSLRLFGKLGGDNYYRAFRLVQ